MTFPLALTIYLLVDHAWQQRWPLRRDVSPPLLLHDACPGQATPILTLPVRCAGCGLVIDRFATQEMP